jgi:hypothetical protein
MCRIEANVGTLHCNMKLEAGLNFGQVRASRARPRRAWRPQGEHDEERRAVTRAPRSGLCPYCPDGIAG